ncbi:hypothetical protein BDZ94DRAFT_1250912 [Collybia nuda]|uniref:F-box domain-containing protein n=1 Tax=Collybia nuda TaxID=64659 RepID=A0A9P5YBC9_9AGAR|nr:hypothetical protein BDZ94DRAFT_1250912 [Collybia nuda]
MSAITTLRSVNERNAPVLRLPPEISLKIFKTCFPDKYWDRGSASPLLLGKICGAWRDLAWSTPLIWTSISIHSTRRYFKAQLVLVKEWLGRTAGQPLSIFVDYRTIDPKETKLYVMQMGVLKIIAGCARQWYSISFIFPIIGIEAFRHVHGRLPFLTVAALLNPHPHEMYLTGHHRPLQFLCDSPKLWDVMVAGYPPSYVGLPGGAITQLWLDHTSIKRALEVIRDSPNLKQCTVRVIDTNEIANLPFATAPALETFKVFGFNMQIGYLFSHLDTPALRNLALHLLGVPLASQQELVPFLSRCNSLISLRLSGVDTTVSVLSELLQSTPGLRHFVDDLALLHGKDIHQVLDLDYTKILPNLQSLLLERVHPNRKWIKIASMLCSRWKSTPGTSSSPIARLDTVTINIEGISPPCKEVLAAFRRLSEEGMNIILKNSMGSHNFGDLSVWK